MIAKLNTNKLLSSFNTNNLVMFLFFICMSLGTYIALVKGIVL